mgnify:CR=1 FL=1
MFFEFGGYIAATVVGFTVGLDILSFIAGGQSLIINIPWDYALAAVIYLLVAASAETLLMKMGNRFTDFINFDKFDFEDRRKEIARELDE